MTAHKPEWVSWEDGSYDRSRSGIGRASARRFADEGTNVVADIVEETGRETVDLIADAGGNATFVEVDVSDLGSVERVTSIDAEVWDKLLDINLKGVWACMKAEFPVIAEHGGGAVVNTASEAGLVGMGGLASCSASKHGVVGLTKSVALEYASRDSRVNAIAPGPTKTNIQASLVDAPTDRSSLLDRIKTAIELLRTAVRTVRADFDASAMRDVLMNRIADPEEIAGVVAFLCSSDASYITGHTVPVNGGQTAD
ncbi:SDR family NAD(P)-dependent oxidoreductase [Halocatena pleomorpha]|uniref:SDR family NAD(P)-dependent oxidoreductase n=1 Tax=Halocatena pleomorpha TaxID=1785090 RepID=UPI001C8A836A|nr:SDR family oxidoreductase [Halocatena pleomorpha]